MSSPDAYSMSYRRLSTFTGPQDHLEELIDWISGGIAVLKHYRVSLFTEGAMMQRQFTIEIRVDFADAEKLPEFKQTLLHCARHAFTTAQLISDNQKSTKIAVFSDDFFSGHQEIALMDDIIQSGLSSIGETTSGLAGGDDEISAELANAFK